MPLAHKCNDASMTLWNAATEVSKSSRRSGFNANNAGINCSKFLSAWFSPPSTTLLFTSMSNASVARGVRRSFSDKEKTFSKCNFLERMRDASFETRASCAAYFSRKLPDG
jgi:hypothetical protein